MVNSDRGGDRTEIRRNDKEMVTCVPFSNFSFPRCSCVCVRVFVLVCDIFFSLFSL